MLLQWLINCSILVIGIRAAKILTYNTLDPKKPLYPVLVLNAPRPCDHYNETLYDWLNAPVDAQKQIRHKLQCSNTMKHKYYYVASSNSNHCNVYDLENDKVKKAKCRQNYPSLCTNSAPPRTVSHPPSTDEKWSYTLRSSYARVVGTRTNIAFTFLGIPYVLPPLNDLRFEDPKCIARIGKKWNATYFRSSCPQHASFAANSSVNEDCLYLNVFTTYIPDGVDTKNMLLPVMVWIHGGAFVHGDVAEPFFDPTHLVSREDVVVVTFHYRLGVFGFWGSGNQAIKDQITVLEWVKEHISAFGGDPNRVTVAGESAGANSVRALLSAGPRTEGLFRAAIMASDVINLGYTSKKDSETHLSHQMAKAVGCATDSQTIFEKSVMDCMRKVPVEKLLKFQDPVSQQASKNAVSITNSELYKPVIDGQLISHDFYVAMVNGNFTKVPIMFGFLRDEGHLFISLLFKEPLLKEIFPVALSLIFSKKEVEEILKSGLYDDYRNDQGTDNVRETLARILTDSHWVCPSKLIISKLSTYTDIYAYYYTYPYLWLHPDVFTRGRVYHTDDIMSFFATMAIPDIHRVYLTDNTNITENDLIFLRLFTSRVGSFMRTGNPNPRIEDLCYDRDFYQEGSNKKTVLWKPFKVDQKMDNVNIKFGDKKNMKIYGTLHNWTLPEGPTPSYGVNKTICDFWFNLGFHAQMYFEDINVELQKKLQRILRKHRYNY